MERSDEPAWVTRAEIEIGAGGAERRRARGMGLYLLQRAGMGDSPQAAKAAAYLLHHMPGALAEPQQWEYHGICWGSAAMALRGGDDARKYAAWIYRTWPPDRVLTDLFGK